MNLQLFEAPNCAGNFFDCSSLKTSYLKNGIVCILVISLTIYFRY